jgi:hypothetical protein
MRLSFLGRLLLIAFAVSFSALKSEAWDGHAPLQVFIDREKANHHFVEVSNLLIADPEFDMARAARYVERASFFTLNFTELNKFMNAKNRCINLVLPNPQGGNFTVSLARYDFLSAGFKAAEDANGKETAFDYTPGLYYRGVVEGIPGSIAAFSFFNNEVSGIFSIPGAGNFVVEPNSLVSLEAGNPSYVLFNDKDVKDVFNNGGCAAEELPGYFSTVKDQMGAVAKNVFNSCKEVQIYVRADYATYQTKGNNTTTVLNHVTKIFNIVSTIYRNEGIYVALKTTIVNTATDAYQSLPNSSGDFLDKFGELTQNSMQGADLAVLFTTRYGGMGGIAWVDVLCDGYSNWQGSHHGPYAFVNINGTTPGTSFVYSWNVNATAHELGHNLGSRHTHWCGWTGGAIDGCWTLEGSCSMPNPQYPTNDGTIMSYCHLVQGVGVNFTNGFGTLPGNKVRSTVTNSSCAHQYAPNVPVTAANVTTNANRECTDPNGITYYWNDGNDADTIQDKIVLKIKKGSNNIGNLDQTGFVVKNVTHSSYNSGTATSFALPTGSMGGNNRAMRQYWAVTPITQPTSAVDVYVPFTNTDIADVDGSVPGAPATIDNFVFYNLESASVNPDPSAGLSGATSSNLKIYWKSNTASTTYWKSSPVGTTQWAQFQTSKLVGGTGFINYIHPLSINNNSAQSIAIYPNPFSDSWNIDVPAGADMSLQVFTADGKLAESQTLHAGGANTVDSKSWAPGFYFYRITGSAETYTGSIVKEK